jgi:hypothetical protein
MGIGPKTTFFLGSLLKITRKTEVGIFFYLNVGFELKVKDLLTLFFKKNLGPFYALF